MRIYSNTILSWPKTLHIFQESRIYTGRWNNYYFYRISDIKPLTIYSYSPMELLQENRKYYCYDQFYRDKRIEKIGNIYEKVYVSKKEHPFVKELSVNIPKTIEKDDIIVIKHNEVKETSGSSVGYMNYLEPLIQ